MQVCSARIAGERSRLRPCVGRSLDDGKALWSRHPRGGGECGPIDGPVVGPGGVTGRRRGGSRRGGAVGRFVRRSGCRIDGAAGVLAAGAVVVATGRVGSRDDSYGGRGRREPP